jgi:hypothetical protein
MHYNKEDIMRGRQNQSIHNTLQFPVFGEEVQLFNMTHLAVDRGWSRLQSSEGNDFKGDAPSAPTFKLVSTVKRLGDNFVTSAFLFNQWPVS